MNQKYMLEIKWSSLYLFRIPKNAEKFQFRTAAFSRELRKTLEK